MKSRLVVGTRQSKLALRQTQLVVGALKKVAPQTEFSVQKIKTEGDRNLRDSLRKIGGKGVFVKEIEKQLLEGKIDFAVHSLKDVMSVLPANLTIGCIPKRDSPFDCLITSKPIQHLSDLPLGSRVGTNSVRRQGQLLHLRPDLKIVQIRGNIDTRLQKISSEHLAGIVLAEAGINRLKVNLKGLYRLTLKDKILPAAGQGAMAIECRLNDLDTLQLIHMLDDGNSHRAVAIERQFLKTLGGDCNYPIGAFAQCYGDKVDFTGLVASENGEKLFSKEHIGNVEDELGLRTARELIEAGALELIK